ncbi:MAG: tRNA (adenosine(37)-N6)-threonylcarbamoyltransferase complex dimerization subunit type 1 TsaB, partial [Candidatus Solibacter usitatus]|nr:tRNA (adenosine(37)-N6)-threonylcarbamoyltransferase complex dimerization subunit type 1 TsaB [Candidatus Solibacter usitatus]
MTPRVLAIDTTGEYGSIAILQGETVMEEMPLHSTEGFGHILFDQVGILLRRHSWEISSIDCFAAASGPGSFTGVR